MAMKQTQTKLFDFSDLGLDICAASKVLFPDRFRKMLSDGYNEQTVASVTISGNQVTLNYGVSHGYVANRVLKVNSGSLSNINNGEFWIDAVTTNSVTFTLDSAPSSFDAGFTTKVASLGWELLYTSENNYVHLYKMKNLDESDLFVRIVFQSTLTYRNRVGVCVGHSADVSTGVITDTHTFLQYASSNVPNDTWAWEFSQDNNATYNASTFSQGLAKFGNFMVVGSAYHFALLGNNGGATSHYINAIMPTVTLGYEKTNYPLLMGLNYGNYSASGYNYQGYSSYVGMMLGNFSCNFQQATKTSNEAIGTSPQAPNSFLPTEIDSFNTTTCCPVGLYIQKNGQFLGYIAGGMYAALYDSTNKPTVNLTALPLKTYDIDLNNLILIQPIPQASPVFFALPVEEIKVA